MARESEVYQLSSVSQDLLRSLFPLCCPQHRAGRGLETV